MPKEKEPTLLELLDQDGVPENPEIASLLFGHNRNHSTIVVRPPQPYRGPKEGSWHPDFEEQAVQGRPSAGPSVREAMVASEALEVLHARLDAHPDLEAEALVALARVREKASRA